MRNFISCDLRLFARIIRMINSRWMKWAGNIARMGEKRNAHTILEGNPEGNGGRIILKWILER
jgi:hypothetical protein